MKYTMHIHNKKMLENHIGRQYPPRRDIGVTHLAVFWSVIMALFLFLTPVVYSESEWEGNAAMGQYGEFPVTGFYGASHAFPRNTLVEVTNKQNGKKTTVMIVNRLSNPNLLVLLSREAAESIGIAEKGIVPVKVTKGTREYSLLPIISDDTILSQDLDINPAAAVKDGLIGLDEMESSEVEPDDQTVTSEPDQVSSLQPTSATVTEEKPEQKVTQTSEKAGADEDQTDQVVAEQAPISSASPETKDGAFASSEETIDGEEVTGAGKEQDTQTTGKPAAGTDGKDPEAKETRGPDSTGKVLPTIPIKGPSASEDEIVDITAIFNQPKVAQKIEAPVKAPELIIKEQPKVVRPATIALISGYETPPFANKTAAEILPSSLPVPSERKVVVEKSTIVQDQGKGAPQPAEETLDVITTPIVESKAPDITALEPVLPNFRIGKERQLEIINGYSLPDPALVTELKVTNVPKIEGLAFEPTVPSVADVNIKVPSAEKIESVIPEQEIEATVMKPVGEGKGDKVLEKDLLKPMGMIPIEDPSKASEPKEEKIDERELVLDIEVDTPSEKPEKSPETAKETPQVVKEEELKEGAEGPLEELPDKPEVIVKVTPEETMKGPKSEEKDEVGVSELDVPEKGELWSDVEIVLEPAEKRPPEKSEKSITRETPETVAAKGVAKDRETALTAADEGLAGAVETTVITGSSEAPSFNNAETVGVAEKEASATVKSERPAKTSDAHLEEVSGEKSERHAGAAKREATLIVEAKDSVEAVEKEEVLIVEVETESKAETAEGKTLMVEIETEVTPVEGYGLPSMRNLEKDAYYLQLGAFRELVSAKDFVNNISKTYPVNVYEEYEKNTFKVLVGPLNHDESGTLLYTFRSKGYKDAFIRKGNP